MSAAMLRFPLARWAARFDRGAVRLSGRDGDTPVEVPITFEAGRIDEVETLRALLERLHDPGVEGHADTDAGLLVKIVRGFTARLPPGTRVNVRATTRGPPEEPRLDGTLSISVSGEGVVVGVFGATFRVRSGTLSPEGVVRLHGDGWLARGLLRLASLELTREVQRSARFARVRPFLRAGPR